MNAPQKAENLNAPHTNASWHARRQAATPRGVGVFGDFFIQKAKNAEFWDIEGRRFIDFAGGIAVLNTGHVHPKVQAAIAAQLQRFTHSCYQVVPYTEYVALAERINALVPIDGPVKTAFFSTGAEAIENAMKIARSATGRSGRGYGDGPASSSRRPAGRDEPGYPAVPVRGPGRCRKA